MAAAVGRGSWLPARRGPAPGTDTVGIVPATAKGLTAGDLAATEPTGPAAVEIATDADPGPLAVAPDADSRGRDSPRSNA